MVSEMGLLEEIREQPAALTRVVSENTEVFADVAGSARGCTHVVIAARGTSDNAARYAQYAWGMRNGLTVALATPSLFTLYGKPPHLEGALVLGISQSGQSPDIVSVLGEGRAQGRPTVAVTNDPGSPLANAADIVVPLHSGPETAIAATKTYTAQLAAIAAISEAMQGRRKTLDHLPELASDALEQEAAARSTARAMSGFEHAAVLGRGFNLSTAFEWALKMQELSYVVAQPFSTADFLHGSIAVVDRGYPVLAVVPEGQTHDDVAAALQRAAERGAPTAVITNSSQADAIPGEVMRFSGAEEWLTPIPAIVVAQLFTYWLTVEQGNDPDNPRGLEKVTRTR
jgi:glucosamine--fructose-6-phosphate aminotransferase (isomerizing)